MIIASLYKAISKTSDIAAACLLQGIVPLAQMTASVPRKRRKVTNNILNGKLHIFKRP